MIIHRLMNHLLGKAEEINGGHRCPTYMYRWVVLPTRWGKLYLHKFVGDDWARDLHDHPKRFISIGVWGSYLEENTAGFRRYSAPWIRTFPAEHRHRITIPWGVCWTLVFVGKPARMWGFWPGGKFIAWRDYVFGPAGDNGKACSDE